MAQIQIHDGGPAFPNSPQDVFDAETGLAFTGMSLRDYFAAKALPALIAAHERSIDEHDAIPVKAIAFDAFKLADAMLHAREGK